MESMAKRFLFSLFALALFTINSYAQSNFVYINNNTSGGNSVSAYAVGAGGALTQVSGSPYATGGAGNSGSAYRSSMRAAASIIGSFLYVANEASNNVSVYTINPLSGALALVPGSPFATGGIDEYGLSLAATPDNHYLVVANAGSANNDGSISVLSIAAGGALMPVAGSPFAAQFHPSGVKISADGKFVYLTEPYNDQIAAYSIDSNGALTAVPGSPFANGGITLEMNCAGTLLFSPVLNFQTTKVNVFNVAANGALALVQGSPFIFAGGVNNEAATLSPDDRFLFISNGNSNTVTVLNVAANGSLSAVPGSPFPNPGGNGPQQLTINQSGTLLYVTNNNATVSVFNIAANGMLTPAAGSSFAAPGAGSNPGIAAYPPKSCNVAPITYDVCIQDDTTNDVLKWNSQTGDYLYTQCRRKSITLGGKGKINRSGCTITLQDARPDRSIQASFNSCAHYGTATIYAASTGITYTIKDPNTLKNTCRCP